MKDICKNIFTELNEKSVSYCHFKSNKYLEAGLDGNTDLDILVSENDFDTFIQVISSYGFKEFEPNEFCKYPGVTNWYGMDDETGIIIHIHLHTHLITGKSLVKDYIIPWDNAVLSYSRRSTSVIRIDDPEMELVLLFARLVVKRNKKQKAKSQYNRVYFSEDEWSEVKFLRSSVNRNKFQQIFTELLDEEGYFKFRGMLLEDEPISVTAFLDFESYIRNKLIKYRRMSSIKAEIVSFIYRARRRIYMLMNKKFNSMLPVKKRCKAAGPIFAFIGIDGSGKSTMINEVLKWLSDEFDVKNFYLGAGQGNASIVAKILIGVYQSYVERHEGSTSTESNMTRVNVPNNSVKDRVKAYFASMTYLSIAYNNIKCIKKAVKMSSNGGIVLCDRFPQSSIEVVHDGMKVQRYAKAFPNSILISKMAKKERNIFNAINNIKCTLYIFRMNVDPEVSYSRKKENERNSDERKAKAESLSAVEFSKACKIIDIDCNQGYTDVLLSIKKAIWEAV